MSTLALILTVVIVVYAAEGLLRGRPVHYWPAPGWSYTYGGVGLALAILWLSVLLFDRN
jgi:hypothetical protein